ncbi:MAG: CAP domain-containing protein [Sphingomonas adhaesiva]|uniref:CAP domain-containing protein n=1 Tax=Sphingomonas adhaesiva TaxID=28212 RepID=UPI002FFBC0A1
MASFSMRWMGAALLPLMVTGCGGGDGGSGSGGTTPVVVAPAPTPSPTASATAPAPSPSPSPSPSGTTVAPFPAAPAAPASWNAGVAALYATAPDVPNCRAGVLNASVRADVLTRLNALRAIHHLPAVTYADADEEQATQAALLMAANGKLDHFPTSAWTCYTENGRKGAGSSNLYGGLIASNLAFYSEDAYLAGWMIETSNIVANNVGHRRWMLDPFLGRISYGRVAQLLSDGRRTDASALKVFDFAGGVPAPGSLPAFVAYPQGDYPARYFDPRALLSFSVIADATQRGGANATVNFSAATVTVKAGTTTLAVSNITFDNVGYGLPNNIQFNVAGLQDNVTYEVTVANVTVRGAAKSYTYTFRTVG